MFYKKKFQQIEDGMNEIIKRQTDHHDTLIKDIMRNGDLRDRVKELEKDKMLKTLEDTSTTQDSNYFMEAIRRGWISPEQFRKLMEEVRVDE